jgi:hypothetical protein
MVTDDKFYLARPEEASVLYYPTRSVPAVKEEAVEDQL